MTMTNGVHDPISSPELVTAAPVVRGWAAVYQFLELALAHPGEELHDWLIQPSAEGAISAELAGLGDAQDLRAATVSLGHFFDGLRALTGEAAEAAHIALFTANFPSVPCPPYGSLFTVEEPKRLEEMLAIKAFYRDSGFDLEDGFDDLPDHLCVELELMHALTFRVQVSDDPREVDWARERAGQFIDRFLAPFIDRLAEIARAGEPDNCYGHLLEATRRLVACHRRAHGAFETGKVHLS